VLQPPPIEDGGDYGPVVSEHRRPHGQVGALVLFLSFVTAVCWLPELLNGPKRPPPVPAEETQRERDSRTAMTVFKCVSLGAFITTCVVLWVNHLGKRDGFVARAGGLRVRRWGRERDCFRWSEVIGLWEAPAIGWREKVGWEPYPLMTILLKGGKRFTLSDWKDVTQNGNVVHDLWALRATIRQCGWMERNIQAFLNGEALRFGPLTATREELRWQGHALSWADIVDIELESIWDSNHPNYLRAASVKLLIREHASRQRFPPLDALEMDNLDLLFALRRIAMKDCVPTERPNIVGVVVNSYVEKLTDGAETYVLQKLSCK